MTIGSVIVVNGLARTVLLPKGTQGIIRAENGKLLDLSVDGTHYADIPAASVEVISDTVSAIERRILEDELL